MRIVYDSKLNAAYIYLCEAPGKGRQAARTIKASKLINLDLDEAGHLVGIELLNGGDLLHPDLMEQAYKFS